MTSQQLAASADENRQDLSAPQGVAKFSNGYYDLYVMRRRRVWRPPTDVYETDDQIIVKVEIAGMNEDDFQVAFADRTLIISGQRRDPVGKLIYQNMEIRYGEFRTEVRFERPLDEAAIEANYEAGFLFVRLPKAMERRVQVRRNDPA